MDEYYLKENLTLFVNNDSNEKKAFNKCDFTFDFKKPLIFDKRMECSLIKLHCPSHLFTFKKETFDIKLHLQFMDLPPHIVQPPISFNSIDLKYVEFNYSIPAKNYPENEFIEIIREVNNKMNIQMKKIWDNKYFATAFEDENPEPITALEFSISPNTVKTTALDFIPIKLLNLDKNSREIYLQPGYIILDDYSENIYSIAMIGYVTIDKLLHKSMGLDMNLFPSIKFNKKGYDFNPVLNKDKNNEILIPYDQKKIYIVSNIGGRPTLNFNYDKRRKVPDVVYVYCNIVTESYVINHKVNLLQMFLLESNPGMTNTTIDFENLIYIPLRIEEVNSISIEMRDSQGDELYYTEGSISAILKFRPIEQI